MIDAVPFANLNNGLCYIAPTGEITGGLYYKHKKYSMIVRTGKAINNDTLTETYGIEMGCFPLQYMKEPIKYAQNIISYSKEKWE